MDSRRPRPARIEVLPVICRQTPRGELAEHLGVLTLEYVTDTGSPRTATFDSIEQDVEGAVIPVHGFVRSERTLAINDGQRWRFQVLLDVDIDELVHEEAEEPEEAELEVVRPLRSEDSLAAHARAMGSDRRREDE